MGDEAQAAVNDLVGELERVWGEAKKIGVSIDVIVGAIDDGADPARVIALATAAAKRNGHSALPGGLDRFLRTALRLDRALAKRRDRHARAAVEDAPPPPATGALG